MAAKQPPSPSAVAQTQKRASADPEIFGRSAMLPIIRALPPLEAAYAMARFTIMRSKLLSVMDLLLPPEGRILDVGIGGYNLFQNGKILLYGKIFSLVKTFETKGRVTYIVAPE